MGKIQNRCKKVSTTLTPALDIEIILLYRIMLVIKKKDFNSTIEFNHNANILVISVRS